MLTYKLLLIGLLICDSVSSVWSAEVINNTWILGQSNYCFANNATVRSNRDNTQLTIVNDTGDWLVVGSNAGEQFILSANILDCEDDEYKPDIVIYVVQTFINCLTLILAAGTFALHLCFKKLRTVFGMLIMILCFIMATGYIVILVQNRYQYTHKVNDNNTICAILTYIRGALIFVYHSIVVTVFFHFTSLMYKTYKMRLVSSTFDWKLLLKYVMFIISVTTVCAVIIIPYDVTVTRNAFDTAGGYCKIEFEDHVTKSFYIYIAALSIAIATQMVIFSLGMILYFLSIKNFCEFKPINIRVCLALISTSGLNTLLFLISYSLSGSTHIPALLSSVATLVEQLVLFMIFSTSTKVKSAVTSITSQ